MHYYPLIPLYLVTLTAKISRWICKYVVIYYCQSWTTPIVGTLNSVCTFANTRKRTIFCFCKYLLFVSSVLYLDRMG